KLWGAAAMGAGRAKRGGGDRADVPVVACDEDPHHRRLSNGRRAEARPKMTRRMPYEVRDSAAVVKARAPDLYGWRGRPTGSASAVEAAEVRVGDRLVHHVEQQLRMPGEGEARIRDRARPLPDRLHLVRVGRIKRPIERRAQRHRIGRGDDDPGDAVLDVVPRAGALGDDDEVS